MILYDKVIIQPPLILCEVGVILRCLGVADRAGFYVRYILIALPLHIPLLALGVA